jgi:hypothetical protein
MPASTLLTAAQDGYRDPTGPCAVTGRAAIARAIGAWMHASGRTMPRHLAVNFYSEER